MYLNYFSCLASYGYLVSIQKIIQGENAIVVVKIITTYILFAIMIFRREINGNKFSCSINH